MVLFMMMTKQKNIVTQFKAGVQIKTIFDTKIAKVDTLSLTKTAEKAIPFEATHTHVCIYVEGVHLWVFTSKIYISIPKAIQVDVQSIDGDVN